MNEKALANIILKIKGPPKNLTLKTDKNLGKRKRKERDIYSKPKKHPSKKKKKRVRRKSTTASASFDCIVNLYNFSLKIHWGKIQNEKANQILWLVHSLLLFFLPFMFSNYGFCIVKNVWVTKCNVGLYNHNQDAHCLGWWIRPRLIFILYHSFFLFMKFTWC